MKNTELRFFIDTTVAVSAETGRNKDAWILLESGRRRLVSLFVNEFVIKEMRWTLTKEYIESTSPSEALKKLRSADNKN